MLFTMYPYYGNLSRDPRDVKGPFMTVLQPQSLEKQENYPKSSQAHIPAWGSLLYPEHLRCSQQGLTPGTPFRGITSGVRSPIASKN